MKRKKNNSKLFFISIIGVITVLTGFYIYQISEMSHISYLANKKETEIKELKKENSGLKLSISKNKNLVSVEEKISEQGYNKVNKIDYIVISANAVAQKD
jgi:cell division protein FtsL